MQAPGTVKRACLTETQPHHTIPLTLPHTTQNQWMPCPKAAAQIHPRTHVWQEKRHDEKRRRNVEKRCRNVEKRCRNVEKQRNWLLHEPKRAKVANLQTRQTSNKRIKREKENMRIADENAKG